MVFQGFSSESDAVPRDTPLIPEGFQVYAVDVTK